MLKHGYPEMASHKAVHRFTTSQNGRGAQSVAPRLKTESTLPLAMFRQTTPGARPRRTK